ncbi:MAG: hypothetical protein HUK02_01745, partial [Bacteroidaceae bacterium]|nr:hypothetical protein [Bacteroidaceae bacterium]
AEATFYQPTELVVGNTYEAGIREEGYYYYTFTPTTDGCVTLNPNSEIYNIMVTTGNFMMNAEEDEDMDEAVEVETYSIAVETDDEEDEIDEEFGWGWGSTLSKTAWNVKAGETYYVMMLGGMEGTTFTVEWSDEPYVPTYELGHDKNPINLNENNNTWTWVSADQEGNHTRDDMEFGYEYYTWTAEASGFILLQHAGSCDHFHVGEGGLYDDWKYYEGPAANVIMQPTPYGEVSTVENWKDNTSYSVVEVEAGETYYIATDTPAFGFIYNEAYSEVVLTLTYFATLEELYAALNGEDGINSIDADGNKVIYNLGGTRIQKAVKGVNIINGKKVMVKK